MSKDVHLQGNGSRNLSVQVDERTVRRLGYCSRRLINPDLEKKFSHNVLLRRTRFYIVQSSRISLSYRKHCRAPPKKSKGGGIEKMGIRDKKKKKNENCIYL